MTTRERPPHEEAQHDPPGSLASASVTAALPAAAPWVELRAASVRLGQTLALDDISLTVGLGERLVLVGANGSGKTTLLRLLHGLVSPTQGQRVVRPGAKAPVMAMVFQRPFLLNLSVRWNLLLALWLRGVPRAERPARCQVALDRVGLARLQHQRARELSGGQQQRLALARAWALQPDILFLDEPTASLDPGASREVEALVAGFAADGMTVVMSTHNLGQAQRLATRVACLEAGRLIVERPVHDFFSGDSLPPQARQFLNGELPWSI
jgi:tungstate transport system ATP-binding protein